MKKRPSSPSLSSTVTPSSSPTKKTKTKENKVWAKTIAHLCITKADPTLTNFTLGDLRHFLDKGFEEDGYSSNRFYQFKQANNKEVIPSYGVSVFEGVKNVPCTAAHMTAFFKGAFCTDRLEDERKGTLLLGCYNPPPKEVQKKIVDEETKASMDALLDQAPQHCNKKNTTIYCSYYVKDSNAICIIVKNFATKMIYYSNMELKKGTPYNPAELPPITRSLHLFVYVPEG